MRSFWVWIAAALLAGCGSERVPATKYYKLDIPPAPAPAGPPAPLSLRIEPLRATGLLHRWAEAPSDTVTKALADQLAKRRVFRSVKISDAGEKADLVLRGSIDRLQEVDYKGGVRVQVSISAELEDPAQGRTIWSSTASSESAVTKSDVQAVVAAMATASQQSIARLMTDVTKFVQVNRLAAATPTR